MCARRGAWLRARVGLRLRALLFDYVASLRRLLAGDSASDEGRTVRKLHWPDLTSGRPLAVPLWLSVFRPKGTARAPEVANGIIGAPHATLPSATMVSGTVLEPGEHPNSDRVKEAVGPWRVVPWHAAYAQNGATAVDAMPGGAVWRQQLEEIAPNRERRGRTRW